jgi:hypothetical protein
MKLNSPFSDSGDFNISVWDDLNVGTSPTVHEKETGRSVVIVY